MKEQEEALNASKMRLELALIASNNAVFEYCMSTQTYTYVENFYNIVGKSSDVIFKKLKGKVITREDIVKQFYHPDDADVVTNAIIKIEKLGSCVFEARIKHNSGEYVWCKIYICAIIDEYGNR